MSKQNTRHFLDEALSDAEKAQLEAFCANPMMKDAVKKVLLFPIYHNGTLEKGQTPNPLMNFLLSYGLKDGDNETVGRDVRIQIAAVKLLEAAYMEIEGYEKVVEPGSPENNAR